MTKEQQLKIDEYYLELMHNGSINTTNEVIIFRLAIEKAFSLNGVVKSFYCWNSKCDGKKCKNQCMGCEYYEEKELKQ